MNRHRYVLIASLTAVACGQNPDETTGVGPPSATLLPGPDLSSPLRFRPGISGFAASAQTATVGEPIRFTARVSSVVPSATVEWHVVVDPESTGVGTLSPSCGSGHIDATLTPNYHGTITVKVYASDSRGATAVSPPAVTITVE